MRVLKTLVAAASLSGCNSGIGYVASNYGVELGQPIHTKDGDFKIWDHKAEGKMLVSPTISEVIDHPTPQNSGISVEGGPEAEAARQAAITWFAQQSRVCRILTTREVARPEFEHTYSCK